MKKIVLLLIIFLTIGGIIKAQIIPQPNSLTAQNGRLDLPKTLTVQYPESLKNEAVQLQNILSKDFGMTATKGTKKANIKLIEKNNADSPEGYELNVDKKGVVITGNSPAGVFYGIQTLRQLIKNNDGNLSADYVQIKDAPRFKIRSYMLDTGRYFKEKEIIKSLLDEISALKFNTFHWHLTDDQGWRIEIKKYPLLTTVGSKRANTQIGGWNSKTNDGKPHEGFYTQEDIKEIVAYAKKLHINIIPEIEMPGHSSAAVASYSWLGVTKQKISVPGEFGVHYNIFDVSDAKVKSFLKDVLTEVMDLFPSKIIHIGGDEVKYNQWNESPAVQAYMKEHKLPSSSDLQVAFTNEISNFVTGKGRRMMGWNDIMGIKLHEYNKEDASATGKLAPQTIVQFWKGDPKLINTTLERGYDIINSYHVFTYLDYSYKSIPIKKSYEFEPIPADIDPKYHKQVLGLGTQMWSEWVPTVKELHKQTFPRIAAYSEVGWTNKDKKDFNSFSERLNTYKTRWKRLGIGYYEE